MAEWIKVILLGIVQGVTEFLPISSTGHLIVTGAILNFENSLGGTFEIFIQLGSVVAVIGFYRADLLQQVRTLRTDPNTQRLWVALLIAAIPAGIIGFLFRDWIKDVLFTPSVVALALVFGGVIFILVESRPAQPEASKTASLTEISPRQALMIGFIQVFALIPGMSRSGSTIIGGLLAGLDRRVATAFSFYLSIPVLGGATIADLVFSLDDITGDDLLNLLLGAVVSGIVAWFAIGWLLRYVARNNFIFFGYYRIAVGIVILVLVAANII